MIRVPANNIVEFNIKTLHRGEFFKMLYPDLYSHRFLQDNPDHDKNNQK